MVNKNYQPLYQIFQNTSCHAGNWLEYTKSPLTKGMIMIFLIPVHCAVLYFFIYSIFLNPSLETSTSLSSETPESGDFFMGPKITVCNPRMFDKAKVEALNISSELLSYIFIAYDYGNDLSYVNNFIPNYEKFESEYVTKTQNISNIGKHLAIKCEGFIDEQLCGTFFDLDPWISYFGTCFTSKYAWHVSGSGGLNSIKLRLNASPDYSAEFSELIGERQSHSGVNMVLHTSDHPLAALDNRAINLESGTSNRWILSTSELKQNKLEERVNWLNWKVKKWDFQFCVLPDSLMDRALKAYGYPAWTAYNCEQFLRLQNPLDCSCALTQGNTFNESVQNFTVFPDNADIPMSKWNYCQTRDILLLAEDLNQYNSSSQLRFGELQNLSKALCYPECLQRSFKITKSSIKLNGENQRDMVHIKLFFSTLTKETIEIKPKTRGEILSDVGGTIGMLIGASIISIVELIILYSRCIFLSIKSFILYLFQKRNV